MLLTVVAALTNAPDAELGRPWRFDLHPLTFALLPSKFPGQNPSTLIISTSYETSPSLEPQLRIAARCTTTLHCVMSENVLHQTIKTAESLFCLKGNHTLISQPSAFIIAILTTLALQNSPYTLTLSSISY